MKKQGNSSIEIMLRGQTFIPHPLKALFWKEKSWLLISDLHLGKISHFRKEGIPLPTGGIERNFRQLNELVAYFNPTKIYFLGDLFHSELNEEWSKLVVWLNDHATIPKAIILGNHDILTEDTYRKAGMEIIDGKWKEGSICLRHHPLRESEKMEEYVIAGHVHPTYRLKGKGSQSIKFPCFYFGKEQAILPSFGQFTGGMVIEPGKEEGIIGIINGKLMEIHAIGVD